MNLAVLSTVVALVSLAATGAPSARATEAEWFENLPAIQQQAIVDYLYIRSPQTSVPYPGEAKIAGEHLTEIVESEPRTAPEYGELAAGETTMLEDAALIPKVWAAAKTITAAGLAFSVGWEIGEGINAEFLHVGLSEGSAGSSEEYGDFCYSQECGGALIWKWQGESIYQGSTVQQSPGAYLVRGTLIGGGYWNLVRWFEKPCTFSGFTPPAGALIQTGVSAGVNCWFGEEAPVFVDYPYVLPGNLLRGDTIHPYDPEVDGEPDWVSPAPKDPGTAAVEESLVESLDTNEFMQEALGAAMEPAPQPEDDPVKAGIPVEKRPENDVCSPIEMTHKFDPGPDPEVLSGYYPGSFIKHTFASMTNPFNEESEAPKLYWGNPTGFGYRKIAIKHGWTLEDQEATQLALTSPDAVTPDLSVNEDPTTKVYYKYYTGLDEKQKCTRIVVVQWSSEKAAYWPTPEEPSPKYIITSFARPYGSGDP